MVKRRHTVGLASDNYEVLKKVSAAKGVSLQSFVNNLISNFGVADKTEKVILSVPSSLTKHNKDGLRDWLQIRMTAVLSIYYPK